MNEKIQLVEGYFLQVSFIELAEKYLKLETLRKIRTILKSAVENTSSKYHKELTDILKNKGYEILAITRCFKELTKNESLADQIIRDTLNYFCDELFQSVENDHMRYKLLRTKADKKKLDMDID